MFTWPVSTAKPGKITPTGTYSPEFLSRNHRSKRYNNAPMPNMNRLTWSGVALHAGKLPGYPASHGCIRLPYAFAPTEQKRVPLVTWLSPALQDITGVGPECLRGRAARLLHA